MTYPMMPGPVPACRIQWIDCKGEPTPDENPAVGLAVIVQQGERKAFPICREHLRTLNERSHHDAGCRHGLGDRSAWSFEPY